MAGVIFKNRHGVTTSVNAPLDKTDDSTTGIVNNPVKFLAYQGKETDSAITDVDNSLKTISVTVKGAGNDDKGNVISDTYINDITISQEADGKLKLQADAPNKKNIVDKTFEIDLKKAKGMYFDEDKELDPDHKRACWFLTSEVDENGQGTKESIISGPYRLGAGGGGSGGGMTDTDLKFISIPSAITMGVNCTITIYWESLKRDQPTGKGTITVYVNNKQVIKRTCEQGQNSFDITEFLVSGENIVKVTMQDMYGSAEEIVATIKVVALSLQSNFDYTRAYTGTVNYTFTPIGNVDKMMHFLIDGKEIGTKRVRSSGEPQTFQIRNLGHKVYEFTAYFEATIDGEIVRSNELVYDLIHYAPGNKTPLIASQFKNLQQEQYISFSIPYIVYVYGKAGTTNVTLSADGEVVNSLAVDQTEHYWEYRSDDPGTKKLAISCTENGTTVEKVFNVEIKPSTINVTPVTENLALSLSSYGKSNDDLVNRTKWEYIDDTTGEVLCSCKLSNFNYASDGWLRDAGGNTVLRVQGDARVEIPYAPFATEPTTTGAGKTIEIELATSTIRDYDSIIMSCLNGGESVSKSVKLAGDDERTHIFEIDTLDIDRFKVKVGKMGTYRFKCAEARWFLDDVQVSLADYGIKLKHINKSTDETDTTPFEMDGDTITVTYTTLNRGFYLTPQLAKLQSQQTSLQTQYKEDDHVRLAFVIEPRNDHRLLYMYINGIMSGVARYPESDVFKQLQPAYITIGSNNATTDLYSIKIYNAALNRKQIVNNWIADTQDPALKAKRYKHNDNYDEQGQMTIKYLYDDSRSVSDLPYLTFFNMTDNRLPDYKGDKLAGDLQLVSPDADRSFETRQAQYNVQGTSSQYYYRKNFKVKFKGPVAIPNYEQDPEPKETKFRIRENAKKEKSFTLKADVASSEGANNVELVRYYQDSKNWETPAEANPKDPTDKGRIRVGIDGFPCIAFFNDGNETTFYGKMNFNNDKGNKSTYGFTTEYTDAGDYVGGDESWEITNNSNDIVLFKKDNLSEIDHYDETEQRNVYKWETAFESRYPDDNTPDEHIFGRNPHEIDKLQEMCSWVCSTHIEPTDSEDVKNAKLKKFHDELPLHFDLDSSLFYYLYTELFLMVDSRAKNAFPTYYKSRVPGDGGNKWFWIPYDMDTAIGINNEGVLVFDYYLEDDEMWDGAYIYNGQDSTFWQNLRQAYKSELRDLYEKLRSGAAGNKVIWSFNEIEDRYEKHQGKWSENIFNEDAYVKYLEPLINNNDATYLSMIQGSKAEQRRWWLYNRFRYLDSKYRTGDAKGVNIMLRAYARGTFDFVPYANCYVTAIFDQESIYKTVRAKRDQTYHVEPPDGWDPQDRDAVVSVYSADMLKEVGDLSTFQVGFADFSSAIKLQHLKLGDKDPTYDNQKLTEVNVGNNTMLQSIDLRNCTKLAKPIDLSKCINIEDIYCDNTQLTGISLPVGGIIKHMHLPGTLTDLTIRNHPYLTDLQIESTENIQKLWIENIPSSVISPYEWVSKIPAGAAVRLIGIDTEFASTEDITQFYNRLDEMSGINQLGDNVETAQVTGTIHINEIYYADLMRLSVRFPEIKIDAKQIKCIVKFLNDRVLIGDPQVIIKGNDAVAPATPSRAETQQYYYTFRAWDKEYSNVQTDLDINALYDEHLQQYQVNFHLQSDRPAPIPSQTISYGYLATKPEDPSIDGAEFLGWFLDKAGANKFNFEDPIVDDTDLYASWKDDVDPQFVELKQIAFNKIEFTLQDNVAIVAYAITDTDSTPAAWIDIEEPTIRYTHTYTVPQAGHFWIWGKDVAGRLIKSKEFIAHAIEVLNKTDAKGIVDVSFKETSTKLDVINYALSGTTLTIKATVNSHYTGTSLDVIEGKDKFNYNLIPGDNEISFVISDNLQISANFEKMTYYITFETFGKGTQIPPQALKYLDLITMPASQYFDGEIIGGWCTEYDRTTGELSGDWNFATDQVDRDMTLYAKWIPYKEPTEIDVEVEAGQIVKLNLYQSEPNGISVVWSSENEVKDHTDSIGNISLAHTYATSGLKTIKIYNESGDYNIGQTQGTKPAAVSPATVIRAVRFAYNIAVPGENALLGATGLKKLTLTKYMTAIPAGLCSGCTALSEVDIAGARLTYIGDRAFSGCTNLVDISWIPESVTAIGEAAFLSTGVSSVALPDSVKTLGDNCFKYCSNLSEFKFTASLTVIPKECFMDCNFTSLIIPKSVKMIETSAYYGNTNLAKIILLNPTVKIGETGFFTDCMHITSAGPITYDKAGKAEYKYDFCYAWTEDIPDNAFAFTYNSGNSLYDIVLPSTLKTIGASAFYCSNIPTITLPEGITTIKAKAFSYIIPFNSISLPSSLRILGANAFEGSDNLTNVKIYTGVLSLDEAGTKVDVKDNAWFITCTPMDSPLIRGVFATVEEAKVAFGTNWLYTKRGDHELLYAKLS